MYTSNVNREVFAPDSSETCFSLNGSHLTRKGHRKDFARKGFGNIGFASIATYYLGGVEMSKLADFSFLFLVFFGILLVAFESFFIHLIGL